MLLNRDITETHEFLMSIIGSAPYGIITFDLEGYVTIANTKAIQILELPLKLSDLVDNEILNIIPDIPDLHNAMKRCLTKGRKNFDLEEIHFQDKFLSCSGRKILDGMILTLTDITRIKESEVNALNSLLEGQEQERKRLAQEIHDGIGPTLSTIKLNLANIEGELEETNQALGNRFRKSYEMIDEVSNDIRSISHNLQPRVLTDFGLTDALQTLCEKVDDTRSVSVKFFSSGLDERLDEVTELGLYRVCQELINNTLKYAEAQHITLQLLKRPGEISVMYEDDGKGFYPDAVSEGLGMTNIHNRIKALAGEIDIDSQPGRGMTANMIVPH